MNRVAMYLLAIQASTLLVPTDAVCETECEAADRDSSDDFTIVYSGRCKPSAFHDKITNENTHACLVCLYNSARGASVSEIDDVVQTLCEEGYAADVFPFSEISRKGQQFDNEHYAGGGEWNYEIETASGEDRLQYDASRVNDVYYYEAQKKVIEFPVDSLQSLNPFNPDTVINDIQDLDGCDLNSAFCCFAQDRQAGDNNGNCATPYEYNCVDKDPADNANICYVDHSRSSGANHVDSGFSIYGDPVTGKENIEGPIHCHGFAWGDDPLHTDNVYKGNLLFYVSMYDHLTQRGYARNIPGAPMCACAENMAVVTRADCTQISASEDTILKWYADPPALVAVPRINDLNFNACTGLNANNNLYERVRKLRSDGYVTEQVEEANEMVLVGSENGKCNEAIEDFLGTKNISRITSS